MPTVADLLGPIKLLQTFAHRSLVMIRPWTPSIAITTQAELARRVEKTRLHRVRAGRTHRFIDLMFVTVGDRVFCRRYTYGEPSWHSAFGRDPDGQVWLDGVTVDIEGRIPADLDAINPSVNAAYAGALRATGATWMLDGAVEDRAMASTLEITIAA